MKHFKYMLIGGFIMIVFYLICLGINYILTNYPLVCMGSVVIFAFGLSAWFIGKGVLKNDYEIND